MKKITVYETASCDSGGCGRYGSKRFFLNEKDAKKDAKSLYQYMGMVTTHTAYMDNGDILLGEDDGAYTRKQRVIRLAMSKSDEDAIIERVMCMLTEEEQWVILNRL